MRFVGLVVIGTKANEAVKASLAAISGHELKLCKIDVPAASRSRAD